MASPKTRMIRAWAVACGFGRMHGDTVYPSRPSATMERNYLNLKAMVLCGPHTVIPLSGVWPRPKHEHAYFVDDDGAMHPCKCGAPTPGKARAKARRR